MDHPPQQRSLLWLGEKRLNFYLGSCRARWLFGPTRRQKPGHWCALQTYAVTAPMLEAQAAALLSLQSKCGLALQTAHRIRQQRRPCRSARAKDHAWSFVAKAI